MPNLGPTELIIILVIIIAIFGAGKLGDLGGALGRGVKDFKSAVSDSGRDESDDVPPQPVAAATPTKDVLDAASEPEDAPEA